MNDIIPKEVVEAHALYKGGYLRATEIETEAVEDRCIFLNKILAEETWKAESQSFDEFLEYKIGLKKSEGYLLASAGPCCELRRKNSDASEFKIAHFMRVAGMKNARNQRKCLNQSAALAERRGKPMTADTVSEVAEDKFGWLSKAKFKEKNKVEEKPSDEEMLQMLKLHREDACLVLADIGITPHEAIEAWGPPATWRGFMEAYVWMKDVYEDA